MIIDKPWGSEHIWAKTKDYVGKIITIKKDNRLSLQYHNLKEETIYVISGTLKLVVENNELSLFVYVV